MPARTKLVIVESPTKAKTIRKFLPKEFQVEASMGHVRDLPQSAAEIPKDLKKEDWAKIGVNVENDFEPLYVVPKGKSKILRELKAKLKDAQQLYLATDEDREGESISWHLTQVLKPKIPVKRMVFHEITKPAIQRALEQCRDIDQRLVQAQETRRILDRLVGYTLSPVLWKKIAYGLSAGRVQSAGLRLLVKRERERLVFQKANYWNLAAKLEKNAQTFEARLHSANERRVASGKDFDETTGKLIEGKDVFLLQENEANQLSQSLKNEKWIVKTVEEKEITSRPSAPFITSTLQQEANRKLNLSARETMRIAQRLYEEGLITYMRTDSPNLSTEGIRGARSCVESLYGKEFLSPEPRQFTAKQKGAQEAHEAIRPAGAEYGHPKSSGLSGKDLALYELIWKRTVATQMADAKKQSMSVRITVGDTIFSASGMRITFPGFLRAYVEGSDDPEGALEDREISLPEMKPGNELNLENLEPTSHETKPPARYTEASLVRALEKEEIGRPSTYASIIGTILERGYVRKLGNTLVPTFTGIAVIQLLEQHFEHLVDLGFTSEMERSLDKIAEGEINYLPYLRDFYLGKNGLRELAKTQEKKIDPEASRSVETKPLDGVSIRIGRYGAYLVKHKDGKEIHASIPEDIAPADLTEEKIQEILEASERGPQPLGTDPKTGKKVYVLLGRYGPYCQLGEVTEEEPKPKRAGVPKDLDYRNLTLEQALKLLELPRELGVHPKTGKPIVANVGRFGPYVMHDGDFRSLKKEDNVYTIQLDRALEILAQEKKGRGGSKLVREIGKHPKDEKTVAVYDGKYGLYIKHGSKNAALPKEMDPQKITLEEAVKILDEKKKKKN